MRKLEADAAWESHRASKFKRYKGEKLKGERHRVGYGQEGFPEGLMGIPDPPEELYLIGDLQALAEGLAVVGARNATPYGIACARRFAGRAAGRGVPIISGGALGCDSEAHRAALDACGRTVAFLGGGCDEIYPASNHRLFQQIVDAGGAVVSEHSWDYPPLRHTFRARNRLIAGLARATLIVEAGLPSGTFSTADEALAANREVLVVPGSICSSTSKGANRLLYQGATPVVDDESFDDILFGLFGLLRQESYVDTAPQGKRDPLLAAIYANPMHMDEMYGLVEPEAYGEGAPESLAVRLTELQKLGLVARYPDGRYGPKKL